MMFVLFFAKPSTRKSHFFFDSQVNLLNQLSCQSRICLQGSWVSLQGVCPGPSVLWQPTVDNPYLAHAGAALDRRWSRACQLYKLHVDPLLVTIQYLQHLFVTIRSVVHHHLKFQLFVCASCALYLFFSLFFFHVTTLSNIIVHFLLYIRPIIILLHSYCS